MKNTRWLLKVLDGFIVRPERRSAQSSSPSSMSLMSKLREELPSQNTVRGRSWLWTLHNSPTARSECMRAVHQPCEKQQTVGYLRSHSSSFLPVSFLRRRHFISRESCKEWKWKWSITRLQFIQNDNNKSIHSLHWLASNKLSSYQLTRRHHQYLATGLSHFMVPTTTWLSSLKFPGASAGNSSSEQTIWSEHSSSVFAILLSEPLRQTEPELDVILWKPTKPSEWNSTPPWLNQLTIARHTRGLSVFRHTAQSIDKVYFFRWQPD